MSEPRDPVPSEELERWTDHALLVHIATRQEEQTMALADLQAAVDAATAAAQDEHTELAAVVTTAQDIQAQLEQLQQTVAGGGSVSEADIDALTTKAAAITSSAQDAVSQAKAGAPVDPGPQPQPSPSPSPSPSPEPGPAPAPALGPQDRTLYTHDGDPSSIDATVWPQAPFVTSDTPPMPLYYFAGDTQPGEANGDGLDGVWHRYDGSPVATDSGGVPVEASGEPQAEG